MAVQPDGSVFEGCELKLNSYDIGVDMELADAVRRIRFEHPEVACVVITSGIDGVFCAGANITMLAGADHAHKVNFCKFTNETRLEMEEASANSGIAFLAAVNGPCSGGGYELALACDHILLIDDRSSAVSLPEVPLLGVLPGTGGLTRLTDKRHVRRDRADMFATRAEGIRGAEALEWGLVDELARPTQWDEAVAARAAALAAERLSQRRGTAHEPSRPEPARPLHADSGTRPGTSQAAPAELTNEPSAPGLPVPHVSVTGDAIVGRWVRVGIDRDRRCAELSVLAGSDSQCGRSKQRWS